MKNAPSQDTSGLNNVMQRCMDSNFMTEDFDRAWDRHEFDQELELINQDFPNAAWSQESSNLAAESKAGVWSNRDLLAEAINLSNIGSKEEDVAFLLQNNGTIEAKYEFGVQQKVEEEEFAGLEVLPGNAPSTIQDTFVQSLPEQREKVVHKVAISKVPSNNAQPKENLSNPGMCCMYI
jgi:hypothetical protein